MDDELRARLRALLAHNNSMRARVGRRPAVFRRLALRSRHMALAREFFRPAAAPRATAGCGSEGLGRRTAEKSLRGLLAPLRAVHHAGPEAPSAVLAEVDLPAGRALLEVLVLVAATPRPPADPSSLPPPASLAAELQAQFEEPSAAMESMLQKGASRLLEDEDHEVMNRLIT